MSIQIRPMRPGEEQAVSRIYALSWQSAYRGILPEEYLRALPEDRWVALLQNPPFHSLVLAQGDALLGTCGVSAARDAALAGWGEIVSLYLLPAWQGRGYGRALLQAGREALRAQGLSRHTLWVLAENRAARAFYERQGFRSSGDTLEEEIGGRPFTLLRYLAL